MDVEIGGCVGICETDDKGNIIKIEREYFRQGWIFKDWGAFRDSMDAPCYVPELNDTVYTKRDFLALCNDQEETAHTMGFFIGHVTNAWVINELLGSKIAELEEGVHDENITTEI